MFMSFIYLFILQRPFMCSVDDCHASYRRKDHLTRHLLHHEGKLFKCEIENCDRKFVYPSNLKRHVRELHDESSSSSSVGGEKQYVCQELGCGKAFRYPSKLQKHEDSHSKFLSFHSYTSIRVDVSKKRGRIFNDLEIWQFILLAISDYHPL